MYHPTKKPYSPIKHAFPRRRYLDPSRIALVAIVLLLIFFFRFESTETVIVTDEERLVSKPAQVLPGFRPLNESKIAIVTFTTEQKSFTHLSLKNKACKCWIVYALEKEPKLTCLFIDFSKKHDYDLYIDYESDNERGLMWHKFEMVQQVINAGEHDWVWWMDFDTLITNTNTKLEDIIEESLANATDPDLVDYIFTPDWYVHSFCSRVKAKIDAPLVGLV